jgi:hypothetical protein
LLLLPHAANAVIATTSTHAKPRRVDERFMSPSFPIDVTRHAKERGINEVCTLSRFCKRTVNDAPAIPARPQGRASGTRRGARS